MEVRAEGAERAGGGGGEVVRPIVIIIIIGGWRRRRRLLLLLDDWTVDGGGGSLCHFETDDNENAQSMQAKGSSSSRYFMCVCVDVWTLSRVS